MWPFKIGCFCDHSSRRKVGQNEELISLRNNFDGEHFFEIYFVITEISNIISPKKYKTIHIRFEIDLLPSILAWWVLKSIQI